MICPRLLKNGSYRYSTPFLQMKKTVLLSPTRFLNKMSYRLLFLLVLLPATILAQRDSVTLSDLLAPEILEEVMDGKTSFLPKTRPLRQIAGAPPAFYTYFWEFGDGHFSFQEKPIHQYADTGVFEVRLYATNNYDDGKAPPKRSKQRRNKVLPDELPGQQVVGFFRDQEKIQARVNRMPRPGEEMVYVAGYRNDNPAVKPVSGTLIFSFNEKSFKNRNFDLTEVRQYHAEDSTGIDRVLAQSGALAVVPEYPGSYYADLGGDLQSAVNSTAITSLAEIIAEKQQLFSEQRSWRFENLGAGEERYFFLSLHTTPEMIQDTNAVVTLNMLMIPDDPALEMTSMDYELQIVASHDPNKIAVSNRFMNYRFVGQNKELKYKIRFQNTGKGPAKKVDIGVAFSENVDLSSIRIIGQYPECVPCKDAYEGQSCLNTVLKMTADSAHFIFRNIYLPGVQQDGVTAIDSTQGFVEFYAALKGKPDKRSFYARAGIVFDKNEPVITNRAWNRFLPGISPAIIAGYNLIGFDSNRPSGGGLILGGSVAPYSPFRFYPQFELYLGVHLKESRQQQEFLPVPDNEGSKDIMWIQDAAQGRTPWYQSSRRYYEEHTRYTIDLVPVHIRKNLNSWIGTGAGIWISGYLSQQSVTGTDTVFTEYFERIRTFERSERSETAIKTFTKANAAAFLDINIGRVRVGPALGLRYLYFLAPRQDRLMLYATWRL